MPSSPVISPRFAQAFFLVVALVGAGCAHSGTPMHPSCRELPTVEECQAAAQVITHECLRKCVELQCE
jgi:hypothetical protein